MIDVLALYHALPYPLRVAAASLRGYGLRRWRYGPKTERLVKEAGARERWSPSRWCAWREERLAYVLRRAAAQVPYYRAQWQERRRRGDRAPVDLLESWPVLDKDAVREHPEAFVADDCDIRRMYEEHTSGTTGKPLRLWWSRETVRRWYALFDARVRGWHGVSYEDRWAILGGQLVAPVGRQEPPFWVWNHGLRQLYLSSYHLAPDHIAAYLEALRRHQVTYLLGYPSSMGTLALVALERGLEAPTMRVAISNAEPLYDHQREAIERVFGAPVRDTYGMAEIVCMASECEAGTMHLWPEVGIAEILDHDRDNPAPTGESGRLVCTGLFNPDMPLIRYEVGDRGRLAEYESNCGCGRTLPVLRDIEGRLDDVVVTVDGRRIGRLDPVFKADLPIHEAQIIQESHQRVRVRYVPSKLFEPHHSEVIRKRLQDRIGEMAIVFEAVDKIPRSAAGKFRSVISHVANEHDT